jgi:hypothetical protein
LSLSVLSIHGSNHFEKCIAMCVGALCLYVNVCLFAIHKYSIGEIIHAHLHGKEMHYSPK